MRYTKVSVACTAAIAAVSWSAVSNHPLMASPSASAARQRPDAAAADATVDAAGVRALLDAGRFIEAAKAAGALVETAEKARGAGLDLSAAQWAVLSACDTGRGDLQAGEGVVGLRRAFQVAGARTVILSLWPVLDTVAADWMAELYRGKFVRGETTATSVRAASRSLLAARRAAGQSTHPLYWSGFIATGDWR